MSENTSEARLNLIEQRSSAQATDIRGIYGALDEIRDVLVRMQESSKPNIMGYFLILLATCTFLVTIGGLTLAPLYRDNVRLSEAIIALKDEQVIAGKDSFKIPDAEALEDKLRVEHNVHYIRLEDRMHFNENRIFEQAKNTSYILGQLQEYPLNSSERK